ncbi:MAG: glycosyltransferase family 1 protein, partial [Nitrososphaerales archaeon]
MIIDIYHNILWSKYRGVVFSKLFRLQSKNQFNFIQIAETESDRKELGPVDLSYHNYPFRLMFNGSYDFVPKTRLITELFFSVFNSKAELVLFPGYHKAEYWAMLAAAVLTRKKRAVFCDSTIYDQPQSLIKGLLKRLFFSCCDGIFSYGERGRSYVIHYGASPARIFPRCQAAALSSGYSYENSLQQRVDLAPAAASTRFLYVGRLSPEKSLDV